MKFKLKEIRTEDDYYSALSRRDQISDAYPGTELAKELAFLSTIIQQYEEKQYQLEYGIKRIKNR